MSTSMRKSTCLFVGCIRLQHHRGSVELIPDTIPILHAYILLGRDDFLQRQVGVMLYDVTHVDA